MQTLLSGNNRRKMGKEIGFFLCFEQKKNVFALLIAMLKNGY